MTTQFIVTLIAVGIVLLASVTVSIYVIRHYVLGRRWGETHGRITHVGMEETKHPRSGAKLYGPRVNYEYQVGGKTYHGSQIKPDYVYSAKEAFHREILKRYQEGKQVKVRYNARNPTEAFLEIGIPRILLVLLLLALVFVVAVLVLLAQMVASIGS